MIIYNPNDEEIVKERIEEAELILNQIHARHCFISGSFLYKEKYNDIDIFIITRSKKEFKIKNKKAKINIIDFNDLYSLFYHSVSKSCISKNILPRKTLKVTLADFWSVINEVVPTIMNQKTTYHKEVRSLLLYAEYFKTGNILDTFQLDRKIKELKNYKEILEYIEKEVPNFIVKNKRKTYLKRFFYTQAGFYKGMLSYQAQKYLYSLTHLILNTFN